MLSRYKSISDKVRAREIDKYFGKMLSSRTFLRFHLKIVEELEEGR